jgi:hypothetical protein
MQGIGLRSVGLLAIAIGLGFGLAACAHHDGAPDPAAANSEFNTPPTDSKREILAAMHAYFNDPTGIRDAEISEPALRSINNTTRYIVCVRYNAKKRSGGYAGVKDIAAVFMASRFDHFAEKPQEACAGMSYTPFPELQKLSR